MAGGIQVTDDTSLFLRFPLITILSLQVILANFFCDLAMLDYHMLRYYPSTVAAAILFLTRMTLHHISDHPLTITSMGLVRTRSREALGLVS